jgi:hypothetical protein
MQVRRHARSLAVYATTRDCERHDREIRGERCGGDHGTTADACGCGNPHCELLVGVNAFMRDPRSKDHVWGRRIPYYSPNSTTPGRRRPGRNFPTLCRNRSRSLRVESRRSRQKCLPISICCCQDRRGPTTPCRAELGADTRVPVLFGRRRRARRNRRRAALERTVAELSLTTRSPTSLCLGEQRFRIRRLPVVVAHASPPE